MSNRATSILALAGCLAAGCTAIVYGDLEQASGEDGASSGARGGTTQHPAPLEPVAGDGGGATGGVVGGDGGGQQTGGENAVGGASESGGANGVAGASDSGGVGGASTLGGAGEPGGGSDAGGAAGHSTSDGGDASQAGSSAGGQGGAADAGSAGAPPLLPADAARGYKLVVLNNCYRCHGSDLAGQGFYRNITPDEATGIGAWSDIEIARAVVGGTNATGELLCASMPVYSGISPQGVVDLVAFLRSIPARHNPITTVCPGHDP